MNARLFLILGSALACMSVILGAFGAHALKSRISEEMLKIFNTGAQYQMYHALALLGVGLALQNGANGLMNISGWLFVLGVIVFSGSLYALSLSGVRIWGAVTPIGGLFFIIGWVMLTIGFIRSS